MSDIEVILTTYADEIASLKARLSQIERLPVWATAATATANTVALRDASGNTAVAALTTTTIAASGAITVSNAAPSLLLYESDQSANERYWDVSVNAKTFVIRLINDALNSAATALSIVRGAANAITSIALAANTAVTGTITPSLGAVLPRSDSSAVFGIDATSAGASLVVANDAASYIGAATATNNFSGWIFIHETATDLSGAIFYIGNGASYLVSDPVGHYAATSTASKSCVFLSADTPVIQNKRGGSRTYNVLTIRSGTAH